MKNKKQFINTLLFAVCCVSLLLACHNSFESSTSQDYSEQLSTKGLGTFTLKTGGPSAERTILPTTVKNDFSLYTMVFSSEGREDVSVERTNATLNNSVTLPVATWNLTVTAYLTANISDGSTANPFPLTANTWTDGSISSTTTNHEVWYSFSVVSNTTYYVWWNDSYQGDPTNIKTLDVLVQL